jgi:hypothetical protein
VANWFRRRPKRVEAPRLRPRSDDYPTTKLDLAEFTPSPVDFLGRAAAVQLGHVENLARALAAAPTTGAKTALGPVTEASLAKHLALVEAIRAEGVDPAETLEHFGAVTEEYARVTLGGDWYETLLAAYLGAGFLDHLFSRLGAGLPSRLAERVKRIYADDDRHAALVGLLERAMENDPRLASRLAMWGRRILGDTLLVARAALGEPTNADADTRTEPVYTELIAAHTRRMDVLGLTA